MYEHDNPPTSLARALLRDIAATLEAIQGRIDQIYEMDGANLTNQMEIDLESLQNALPAMKRYR